MRAAAEQELVDGRDLREALLAFVQRLTTETVSSSDYAAFRRLSARTSSAPRLPEAANDEPERTRTRRAR